MIEKENIFVWLDSAELVLETEGHLDLAAKIRGVRDEYLHFLESNYGDTQSDS